MYLTVFKTALVILLTHLVQTAFLPSFLNQSWIPDLTLICIAAIGLRFGPVAGAFSGFATGILQDMYASGPLGLGSLANSVVGYGLGVFDEKHFNMHMAIRAVLLAVAILIKDLIFRIGLRLSWSSVLMDFLTLTIPTLLTTVSIGLMLLRAYQKSHPIS